MSERFIGTSIEPVEGTIDPARMSAGEPGLPREFRWQQQVITIAGVLRTWREIGDCHHGSGERYLRKHWFEVVSGTGERMKIYFERQARAQQKKSRWRLYTIQDGSGSASLRQAAHGETA
jgi:hypothetical protein